MATYRKTDFLNPWRRTAEEEKQKAFQGAEAIGFRKFATGKVPLNIATHRGARRRAYLLGEETPYQQRYGEALETYATPAEYTDYLSQLTKRKELATQPAFTEQMRGAQVKGVIAPLETAQYAAETPRILGEKGAATKQYEAETGRIGTEKAAALAESEATRELETRKLMESIKNAQLKQALTEASIYQKTQPPAPLSPSQQLVQQKLDRIAELRLNPARTQLEQAELDRLWLSLDPLESMLMQAMEGAGEESAEAPEQFMPTGKVLDEATAVQILQEAGGDVEKARQIARQRGYNF